MMASGQADWTTWPSKANKRKKERKIERKEEGGWGEEGRKKKERGKSYRKVELLGAQTQRGFCSVGSTASTDPVSWSIKH